jgi:Flp pilus assembly protein TadG
MRLHPKTLPIRTRGQALVELAIVLPVLLLLALGIIEIGRYAYIGILVGNAARAGAIYGAQGLANATINNPGIDNAAKLDFAGGGTTNGLAASALTVASNPTCGCDIGGTISSDTAGNCTPNTPPSCAGHWVVTIHVTASGTYNSIFSYPGIPSSIPISRTASMRVAQN